MNKSTFDRDVTHDQDARASEEFVPLTADQAQLWRAKHPPLPVWPVLLVQALAGLSLVALLAGFASQERVPVVQSALYGVLAAWIPALIFARAELRCRRRGGSAMAGLVALMVWEGIKVLLTVVMLLAALKVLAVVHWPALVAGFVVTIKAAWLAFGCLSIRRRRG